MERLPMSRSLAAEQHPPPDFDHAGNLRQKARASGLDPSYWYPVELERALHRGRVIEITFWRRSIALFRGGDGAVHAIENRCVHRQLKLSTGEVQGCTLVCPYHGWTYDGSGSVVAIPHDLFGRDMPKFRVPSYPVQIRHGLIWIFPGDPALAAARPIPEIPELEAPDPWACVPISFTWRAHHSMIIDNVSDFTHQHLHRRYQPFRNARLLGHETIGDEVVLRYAAEIGRGRLSQYFVDRSRVDADHITLGYRYPYQWSNTGDAIKHWLFVLPIDERHTRAFFLFYFKSLKVPFLPLRVPNRLMRPILKLSNRWLIRPLLSQDGAAVEAEQDGYERHWDAQLAELNPVVRAFQMLTVRKWQEYRETTLPRAAKATMPAIEQAGT
jgi:phenylpropionate dioxygenase-like ring-hydroxylating dioxygenase large terminal subunit